MKPATRPVTRPPADWNALRRRIDTLAETAQRGSSLPADQQRAILRARARALAREAAPATADEVVEVVQFQLAHETYGIETRYVREVCPLETFTPVPGTPAFVLGITNLRGQILSIVDLKPFFDLPVKGLTELDKIIVLRDEHMEFGILADSVAGVRSVPLGALQGSLPTLTGRRQDYLKGVTPERLVILDAARILADPKMVVGEDRPGAQPTLS